MNGIVERLKRDVPATLRAKHAELKPAPRDWVALNNILLSVLYKIPCKRLGKNDDGTTRLPLEVMTGI